MKEIKKNNDKKLENANGGVTLAALIQGKVSGASSGIRIRGAGDVALEGSPLYVVDGVQMENLPFMHVGQLDSIDVLKDSSATAIYGTKGSNGVIIITTKDC